MESTDQPYAKGNAYTRIPLYLRIIAGLILGVILGTVLMQAAPDRANPPLWVANTTASLDTAAKLLLRLLNMIAPPLILIAVVRALITAEIKGRQAGRLMF